MIRRPPRSTRTDTLFPYTTLFRSAQNIAKFETSGFDLEMSYRLPLSSGGSLNFRALATYVDKLITDTGSTRRDVSGNVGDSVLNGLPKWRGIFRVSYPSETPGVDAPLRFAGGGQVTTQVETV